VWTHCLVTWTVLFPLLMKKVEADDETAALAKFVFVQTLDLAS